MSALVTLTILYSKVAWSAFRSKEINYGVMLFAKIAYRPDVTTIVLAPTGMKQLVLTQVSSLDEAMSTPVYGQNQLVMLKATNDEWRRKYEQLLSSTVTRVSNVQEEADPTTINDAGASVSSTRFKLVALEDGLPLHIDPRDTIARRFCSERMTSLLWTVHRNRLVGFLIFFLALLAFLFLGLSLVGDFPVFGYLYVLCLPSSLLPGVHVSIPRLRAVAKSFNFISLFVLNVIAWVGIADAVMIPNEGCDRPFAALLNIFVLPVGILIHECRIPIKIQSWLNILGLMIIIVECWTGVCLWYTGIWVNVKQTILPVGSVSIDIQSVSMSSLVTLTILFTKIAWTTFWSNEINPGVILHAKIAYRPVMTTGVKTSTQMEV